MILRICSRCESSCAKPETIGAGRSKLAKTLVGEIKATGGEVRVRGVITHIKSFREALEKHRFGYVSEDRKQEGLILLHSVRANTSITIWRRLRMLGQWITRAKEDAAILPSLRQLDVRAQSLSQSVGTLSGGNQQKVSIAKWLAAKAEILNQGRRRSGARRTNSNHAEDLCRHRQ